MDLDPHVCERARRSRDPRFDGRFFVGVRTTGIYCRPVCPARPPKESNVAYFATAAAAAEAGLRPCLRCRPECSPGAPAWGGSSVTVSRALRLLAEGALDEQSAEELAARLGVGARHLRRLFLEHVGAPPIAVAQTRRLQFAKNLVDETGLPLSEIALASGFGSIRRFNAVFRQAYGRPPGALRRSAECSFPAETVQLRLRYRPPLDWQALFGFLGRRATAGVESVEESSYTRSIELSGRKGWFRADPDPAGAAVKVRIVFTDPRALLRIVGRIRLLFDLNADPEAIRAHLSRDSLFDGRLRQRPGLRLPGCWDGFELSVRAILGQQISVKSASTLAGRLASEFGEPIEAAPRIGRLFPTPGRLAGAPLERIGLTRARAESIRALACATRDGRIAFTGITDQDSFTARLRELPGLGDWTTQYIAMRALGDPDAFPATDLGLRKASSLSGAELEQQSQAWRPWRAYAAMHLWQGHYDEHDQLHRNGQPCRTATAGRR